MTSKSLLCAIKRYMQALSRCPSVISDSTFRSIQLHTYQPSRSPVVHFDDSRPSVLHLRRIIAGLFNQLASARLSSIQTIQHALHQLSLALFWFPRLLSKHCYHHAYAKPWTFPLFHLKDLRSRDHCRESALNRIAIGYSFDCASLFCQQS